MPAFQIHKGTSVYTTTRPVTSGARQAGLPQTHGAGHDLPNLGGGAMPEWFKFKRKVEHIAANKSGDGGVDVYAHDSSKDELWAVQSKCYAFNHPMALMSCANLPGACTGIPWGREEWWSPPAASPAGRSAKLPHSASSWSTGGVSRPV